MKPKIVWGEISDRSKFAYDHEGNFTPEATTFLMVGADLPYLLCVLNSPVSEWFFSKVGTTTGVGTVRWKKYTIQELLLPNISQENRAAFKTHVEGFLSGRTSKDDLVSQANSIIYGLIGLTDEETRYVENFYPVQL